MRKEATIEKLLEFLRDADDCVVLRNQDVRACLQRGGDVDVLVADIDAFRTAFQLRMGPPSWRIRRSYVEQLFQAWGHIDIATRLEWRGAVYVHGQELVMAAARTDDGLLRPRPAHEAIICWFSSLLWGGFFKERYRDTIVAAARTDRAEFLRVLQAAVGDKWGARLFDLASRGTMEKSVEWVGRLRRALWLRAFLRTPLRTMGGYVAFAARELSLTLAPTTPWIAVLGPDGSGKSTVLNSVREDLRRSGIQSIVHHWRPQILHPGGCGTGPGTNPHAKPLRGLLQSVVKLILLVLDWQIGMRLPLARQRAKARVVMFDRHYLDLLVDPKRYRYGGPVWLALLAEKLIPKPDLLFLLDAPTAVLRTRKQEVPAEETERQRRTYRELVQSLACGRILDATQSPEQVADDLLAGLFKRGGATK